MLVSVQKNHLVVQVDQSFHDLLEENKIYQVIIKGKDGYKQRLKNGTIVNLDRNSIVEPYTTIASGDVFYRTGSFSSIRAALPLNTVVGRYCSIGENIQLLGGRHPIEAVSMSTVFHHPWREHFYNYCQDHAELFAQGIKMPDVEAPQPQKTPLIIGHDVWIGSNVVLKGGLKIGTGAVVAANSVVTKDVPPYTIVGGNPAKVIRKRFPDNVCDAMLTSSWWDYELSDLLRHGLDFANPGVFIDQFEAHRQELQPKATKACNLYFEALKHSTGFKDVEAIAQQYGIFRTFHETYLIFDTNEQKLLHKRIESIAHAPHMKVIFAYMAGSQCCFAFKDNNEIFIVDAQNNTIKPVELSLLQAPHLVVLNENADYYSLDNNQYLCAAANGSAQFNRKHRMGWETFQLVNSLRGVTM